MIKKFILGYSNLLFPLINLWRSLQSPKPTGKRKKIPFFISFDLDYTKDIKSLPQLMYILKKYGIKSSFACIGKFIEMYPEDHKLIISEGHEIMNHTYSHPDNDEINPCSFYNKLNPKDQFIEIKKMQEVCEKILKYKPIGFRLPHFGNVITVDMPNLFSNLKILGMVYDSSLLKFNTPRGNGDIYETCVEGITEFSISTCPYHPYAACDSWHFFRSDRYVYKIVHKVKTFKETFIKLINTCYERQEMINIYLDPCDLVSNDSLDAILEYAHKYCIFYSYCDYLKGK